MPSYTGSECPVCGKPFAEQDDIVVCPLCGSPHHRACYKALGHCGNEEYHEEGRQWQPELSTDYQDETVVQDVVVCRSCGEHNPASNIFCQRCGQKILGTPQGSPPDGGYPYSPQYGAQDRPSDPMAAFFGVQMDYSQELEQGVTLGEAADYVGPNSLSFLMRFQAIAKGALSFNWAAFFFGFFYCFYRKMNKLGWVLLAVFLGIMIPAFYFGYTTIIEAMARNGGALPTMEMLMQVSVDMPVTMGRYIYSYASQLVSLGAMVYCGLGFNRSYYRRMIGQLVEQRQKGMQTPGTPEYRNAVSALGGVNRNKPLVIGCTLFVLYLVVAYICALSLLS